MKFKQIILFIVLIIGAGLLIKSIFFNALLPSFFYSFFYWWLLVFIIFLGLILHFKSIAYLSAAFILFFISAVLTTVGLREIAEIVMRISIMGWIIGLVQSAIEYKLS